MGIFDTLAGFYSNNSGLINGALGVGASLIGNNQQQQAVNGAANRTLPYSSSSDFGSVSFGDGTVDFDMSGNPFAGMLQQLSQAGIANYGATTNDPMAALPPELRAQFTQSVNQNQGAANGFFGALGSFDPNQAAADYTNTLNARALPQEQQQRNQMEDRLFAQGRLGTTGGGVNQEALFKAQGDAALGRQLAGKQFAGQEQSRIAELAQGFGTNATNTALTGFNAAEGARGRMLESSFGANSAYQSLFNPLLQMGNLGVAAGGGQAGAAALLADQARASGDMYSDAFAQLLPAAGDWLKSRYPGGSPSGGSVGGGFSVGDF
jgi:hypothetical protein